MLTNKEEIANDFNNFFGNLGQEMTDYIINRIIQKRINLMFVILFIFIQGRTWKYLNLEIYLRILIIKLMIVSQIKLIKGIVICYDLNYTCYKYKIFTGIFRKVFKISPIVPYLKMVMETM